MRRNPVYSSQVVKSPKTAVGERVERYKLHSSRLQIDVELSCAVCEARLRLCGYIHEQDR